MKERKQNIEINKQKKQQQNALQQSIDQEQQQPQREK